MKRKIKKIFIWCGFEHLRETSDRNVFQISGDTYTEMNTSEKRKETR